MVHSDKDMWIFAVCVFSVHCWFLFFFLLFRAWTQYDEFNSRKAGEHKASTRNFWGHVFQFQSAPPLLPSPHGAVFLSFGTFTRPYCDFTLGFACFKSARSWSPVHLRWSLFSYRSRCSPAPFFGFGWQCSLGVDNCRYSRISSRSQRLQIHQSEFYSDVFKGPHRSPRRADTLLGFACQIQFKAAGARGARGFCSTPH